MTQVNDLGPIVRQLNSIAQSLEYDIHQVGNQVGAVQRDLSVTTAELAELRERFEQYVEVQTRANAVQRATTEIVDLKAQMDREFGKHQVVRDSNIGTLQALDVGIITKDTVQRVSEELMISAPRYWLAPAIVGLAAWVRDDKEWADKAIAESYRRNDTKCSLLFTLILSRQGRQEASAHWVRHYFSSLDPLNLPRDFAVIMEAAARSAFGPAGRAEVEKKLHDWLVALRDDESKVREQILLWKHEIRNQRSVVNRDEFPTLATISPDWPALQAQMESASALGNTRTKYQDIRDASPSLSLEIRDQMDDLLERLVSEYDEDELPLRRQIVRTQAIIDHDGDMSRAQQQADAMEVALQERIDALTMQSYTAIAPDLLGVTLSTQQVSIGAAKVEFRQAITEFAMDYRSQARGQASLVFNETHSNYASAYRFQGCTVSTDWPQQRAEETITQTWDRSLQSYLEAVAFKPTKLILPIIVALVATVIGFAINPVAGVVILLLGGAGVGFYGWSQKKKADAETDKVNQVAAAAKAHTIQMYQTALGEYVDLQLAYEDAEAEETPLLELVDSWHSAITTEEN